MGQEGVNKMPAENKAEETPIKEKLRKSNMALGFAAALAAMVADTDPAAADSFNRCASDSADIYAAKILEEFEVGAAKVAVAQDEFEKAAAERRGTEALEGSHEDLDTKSQLSTTQIGVASEVISNYDEHLRLLELRSACQSFLEDIESGDREGDKNAVVQLIQEMDAALDAYENN